MLIERQQLPQLVERLHEPRRFIQVVAGPRQVGKTTLARQAAEACGLPWRYASADEPTLRGPEWLAQQWEAARLECGSTGALLVLDEVQKISGWSESVKALWDEDSRRALPLRVVILGSAPLLVQHGLTESLAGRFEILRLPHWSAFEMRQAFDWSVEQSIFFGGYPGSAALVNDYPRWARYILDSLVETTISRDVLLLTRVDKPALLRRLFELGCQHSGQELSFNKILGQLQDAGNTGTLAHYLELLQGAGVLTGLPKYAGALHRRRASSPKFLVYNTALLTAPAGRSFQETRADGQAWGRLVESAVGAHLANAEAIGDCELFYWRDGHHEVDFVVRTPAGLSAIEVKSSRRRDRLPGMAAFTAAFPSARRLLVGADGISLEDFLLQPVTHWLGR
jgi:predicted AAA+ superfamily ATPase